MSGIDNAALLALVAVVPLVVLTLTSFVKISVVLSLLRNALGAPDAPSAIVITGLSLVLTFFVMAPVAVQMVAAAGSTPATTLPAPGPGAAQPAPGPGAAQPAPGSGAAQPAPGPGAAQPAPGAVQRVPAKTPALPMSSTQQGRDPSVDAALRTLVPAQYQPQLAAAERAIEPLRAFVARHTRDADRETFASLAKKLGNASTGDELWVIAPAFVTTELREAFVIAILLFVPFLVIDLVVGLGLASLGLQTTSPQAVALPLKLVLLVAVDGWRLLLDALLRGYA
jgi:flagellar biosynthesis protein FliP